MKKLLLVSLLLITLTNSLKLIPSNVNPLQMNIATNNAIGQSIFVSFSFPSNNTSTTGPIGNSSPGLTYHHFLAVVFPFGLGTSLLFDTPITGSIPRFSCALSDSVGNSYLVTPIMPATVENWIAYCRLDDILNTPLKVGPAIVYTLTITLTSIRVTSPNYFRTIGLFTSTSSSLNRIIIDSLPVVGSLAQYNDWTVNSQATITTVITNTAGGTIYPNTSFDMTVTVKLSTTIQANNYVIAFRYPGNIIQPISISSVPLPSDSTQAALAGSLSINSFTINTFSIGGITDTNLVPGRSFVLILKGWTAGDTNVGTTGGLLELYIYYKNTYSIFSYTNSQVFTVNRATISVAINHPEWWDIYRNGAWPFTFTITPTAVDITNGFIVIQHTNAQDDSSTGGNKFSFLASTCDFSSYDTAGYDAFGLRPTCYPMMLENGPYSGAVATTAGYPGSAIFYKITNTIKANKSYTLTVWLFADNCGGQNPNWNTLTPSYSQPAFTVTVYKKIYANLLNTARFAAVDIVGISSAVMFTGKCWNNLLQNGSVAYGSNTNTADYANTIVPGAAIGSTGVGTFMYREYTDWNAGYVSSTLATTACGGTPATTDPWNCNGASTTISNPAWIYGSTALSGSYFAIRFTRPRVASDSISMYFPLPLTTPVATLNYLSGKIVYQFPSNWFSTGLSIGTCYGSWSVGTVFGDTTQTAFIQSNAVARTGSSKSNFFAGTNGPAGTTQIDTTNSNTNILVAPTGSIASSPLRLVSAYTAGGALASTTSNFFTFFSDTAATLTAVGTAPLIYFNFFSNCLVWKAPPLIKSVYTYIDIQVQFHYMIANTAPILPVTNSRFIKLYPEGGVFFDITTTGTRTITTPAIANPYINHVTITASGKYAVCLIELTASTVQGAVVGDTNINNVLSIWLFGGVLIESDYNDVTSTYPVGSLATTAFAYGLQSAFAMNPADNNYIKNTSAGTHNTLNDIIINSVLPSATLLPAGWNRSQYFFYFGSNLIITGLSNGIVTSAFNPNILIPYYCPTSLPNVGTYASGFNDNFFNLPLVIAAWMTQPTFSQVISLNKYVTWKDSANAFNSYLVLYPNNVKTVFPVAAGGGANGAGNWGVTLRWPAYGSPKAPNILYIYLGYTSLSPAYTLSASCTGYSMFISKGVIWDSTVNPSFYLAGVTGVYKGLTTFYVLGRAFNSAAFRGQNSVTTASTLNMDNTISPDATGAILPNSFFTGLLRPAVDSFVVSGSFNMINQIGFFCTSASPAINTALTNYNSGDFYLDWFPLLAVGSIWSTSISLDKITENYLSDPAGNIKLSITPPSSIPANAQIVFSSSQFSANTMCGIQVAISAIYQDCTNTSGTITCTNPTAANSSFVICCYSVVYAEPTGLTSLTIVYPVNPALIANAGYFTTTVFNASAVIANNTVGTNLSFTTGNTGNTNMAGLNSAKLTSVAYSQVYQDGGYGKATFTITLPRDLTRDSKITILGDLSLMVITGTTPRCQVSNSLIQGGTTWDNGDALFDSCAVLLTNIYTPIIIVTKKEIYKCGLVFSGRNLFVSLWPVAQINYSSPSISITYKVNMNLNSSEPLTLAASAGTPLLMTSVVSTTRPAGLITDTLCAVSSIFPNMPGEVADYSFDFDLDSNKGLLSTSQNPNEFTIFWPYTLYGSFINNVVCSYNGVNLNCSFTDEGILNIRNPLGFGVGSGKKTTIIISNVVNPNIDATYSFPCSVNYVNNLTGVRINLLVGTGKTVLVNFSNLITTGLGELRFLNIDPLASSDFTPRAISTHTFRIAFDNLLTVQPVIIINPVIHVYFPSDYQLYLYPTVTPSVNVNEWTANATTGVITQTTSYVIASVKIMGNRVTINFPTGTYSLTALWRYWDIVINGIANPIDTTIKVGFSQTTRLYSVTLTNDVQTILYRTSTNLNTAYSVPMTTPLNTFLAYNRGNAFSYDGTRWLLDIYSNSSYMNVLNIKTGRFIKSSIVVTSPIGNVSLLPSFTTLVLTDPIFSTTFPSYTISTSYMLPQDLFIGCACGTAPGSYIINFTSSELVLFTRMIPIVVNVDNTIPGIISTQPAPIVALGGSAWVGYTLSDLNFDVLTVNWAAGDNNKNDPSVLFSSAIFPSGTITPIGVTTISTMFPIVSVFSITSISLTLAAQTFKTSDPNTCFTFSGINTISFTVNGLPTIIVSTTNLSQSFVYYNGDTDPTVLKNSIKFIFTTPALYPAYIYCALVCINQSYPADADIKVPKIPGTNLIQFYSNFINTASSINVVFNNLVRGQQYHMRCILESSYANTAQRTTTSINFENYLNTTLISPSITLQTYCSQFQFTNDPGIVAKNAMVNYCQKVYSAPGFVLNGCVICTLSDLSYQAPGLSFPVNTTCVASSSKRLLRFLQSVVAPTTSNATIIINTTITTNITIPTTVSVCPVPTTLCPTNPTQGGLFYADYFNKFTLGLSTPLFFLGVTGVANVPLNTSAIIGNITDTTPNIANLTVNIALVNSTTSVWAASYPTNLNCRFMVKLAPSVNPAFQTVWTCTDVSWCGFSHLTMVSTSFSTSTTVPKAFTSGSTYNLFYACYTDIPGAHFPSIVQNVGFFTVPIVSVQVLPSTLSSVFLNTTMIMIMLIFGLLI